jgi:Fe2+ transport system protein A
MTKLKKRYKTLNEGDTGHLANLKKGQLAKVLAVHGNNPALRRRLLDMGITRGAIVKIKKFAPLGDPVDIEIRGYELCLRKSDMQNIDIEVVY